MAECPEAREWAQTSLVCMPQEQIARRGEAGEALLLDNRPQKLVLGSPFSAVLDLNPRLLADFLQRGANDALHGRSIRKIKSGQRLDRVDAVLPEGAVLRAPDVRHERESKP